jgi:hypothetical protein
MADDRELAELGALLLKLEQLTLRAGDFVRLERSKHGWTVTLGHGGGGEFVYRQSGLAEENPADAIRFFLGRASESTESVISRAQQWPGGQGRIK